MIDTAIVRAIAQRYNSLPLRSANPQAKRRASRAGSLDLGNPQVMAALANRLAAAGVCNEAEVLEICDEVAQQGGFSD